MSNQNQHKPGYKHTPLGWIPEEWAFEFLEKFTMMITDGAHLSPVTCPNGKPIATVENINKGYIDLPSCRLISENDFQSLVRNNCKPKVDDVLLSKDGTIGITFPITKEEEVVLLSSIAIIRPTKNLLNSSFLSETLKSIYFDHHLQRVQAGSALGRIVLRDIRKYPLPVPSYNEQLKIAAILSKWDEAITKTQQLIVQLQQRNKGLVQQLLKSKANWKEKKLSDIFDRVVRKNTAGNTNVITISAQRGFVKQNDFFKKLVASETLDNYFLVRKGEFCYNKSYSNGYDWGATKRLNDFDEAVVTTLYICFRIKDENKYSGDYFEYFFDANILDRGLAKIAHEGGRAHGLLNVTPSDFFSLKIHAPHYDEQVRIFNILLGARNELKLTDQKLAALRQLKKGLMQKLLTGEVRVKI